MSLAIILGAGILLTLIFHFIGVWANYTKGVWGVILFLWIAAFSIALSEVKPKGYKYITSIEGKYAPTDALIQEARPKISIYEMVRIKNSFFKEEKKLIK